MNQENLSILRTLKPNIEELIAPLEAAEVDTYGEESENIESGLDFLISELTMTVLLLTGTDSEVDSRELELLNDMRHVVYGYGIPELNSQDYIELCREFLRLYPNSLITVDRMPLSVRLLLSYDQSHGTNYASKARAIFIQFADAVVKVDENENSIEQIILANFKDTLRAAKD
jgi:hypothetical protein